MAKARPKAPVTERAVAAFKKAHPSCPHHINTYKVRSKQLIRVCGYETESGSGKFWGVWSYADEGRLRRIS